MNICIKKLNPSAVIPVQANNSDAGYDLFSIENAVLKPLERKLLKTGIAIEIPHGFYGRIAPRSGLAFKHGIDVLAGVVDSGYRGEIGVILINFGVAEVSFMPGDRIAQLIIETCHYPNIVQSDELQDSNRKDKGFGSTGK